MIAVKNQTMLEFKSVSHHYGHLPSVENLTFSIAKGEVVSLLGPSGCGKSTILRLIAGLEHPATGEIWLAGRKIADNQAMVMPENRGVGLVFQDYALFPHMTIIENVIFGLNTGRNKTLSHQAKTARANDMLERTDLSGLANAMPHHLSGGQQQRVALARALAPDPALILLDEPFAGLDSRLKEKIRDDMLHVLREIGSTVLMVTHDSDEAMFMSDSIIVVRDGRIEQSGPPIDLYCKPGNAFIAEFFGEVNKIDGVVHKGMIKTLFGDFEAENTSDGEEVSLIIRLGGLVIESTGEGQGVVMETRFLGASTLVHMSVTGEDGTDLHLHAKIPGMVWFESGTQVSMRLDDSQVFIFPKQNASHANRALRL